jgi:hypothetical protein
LKGWWSCWKCSLGGEEGLGVAAELGEEIVEGGLEGEAVVEEIVDGGGEFDAVTQAGGHAGEGEAHAVGCFVAGEPVVHGHGCDGVVAAVGEEGAEGVEAVVGAAGEEAEGEIAVVLPVRGEDVIEEDIGEDGGVAAPFFGEKVGGAGDEVVGVGEGIDAVVEGHAQANLWREGVAGFAFDPVGDDVAGEDGGVGRGEDGVGEEVHFFKVPNKMNHDATTARPEKK